MNKERDDVSELGVVFVFVVRHDGDAVAHIVGKANDFVVQHEHVFSAKIAVCYHSEVFDEVVVVLRARLSSQDVHDVLALRVEGVQDLFCVLTIACRE